MLLYYNNNTINKKLINKETGCELDLDLEKNKTNINTKKNISKNKDKEKAKAIKNKSKKPKNINLINESEKYENENVNKPIEIKFKEYLTNYISNDYSIYPILKRMKSGETQFQDIFNFLVSDKEQYKNKK